ncbi:hypothetical protein [Bdellovibrio sp. ArHS]|uniref:hypothetical protein n=1 Tax=Bdellovibrio sp. ArHS TaxID=1569284 RepID=UPI000A826066|nr:hypothetical protein [Bdellovibrio sp. ArHS]
MTKSTLTRVTAAVALIATLGFTHKTTDTTSVCHGFVPENDMKIPVGLFTTGGITEKQFNDVLDRLERIYKADVERMGDTLKVNRLWKDATVNASAQRSGKTQVLNMYGGLARHQATNVEGFALVACHEFGHHNGGAPKISGWMGSWATNEGGADYFATLKCLRRFFAEDDNAAILKDLDLDPYAVAGCEAQFSDEKDRLICLRTSLAGQSVANLFQSLRKETTAPNFGTPDRREVSRTNDQHPETQCRLDTYFQGMLCVAKESETVSNTDYKQGSCYAPRDTAGIRPRCWFFPGR